MAEPRAGVVIPERYRALVERAAGYCPELSVLLVGAQIQVESEWDPDAESSAGAQGIAQFMPGTWRVEGRDYSGDGRADVFDPEDAIPSLGAYMCRLIGVVRAEGIPGDAVDLALAAYNAGLGAVRRYRGIPPYPETRAYLRKVRELARESA
ncbi:lytic transglycosylase domain-containing protein [Streptomyces sp. ODS28]|uniref:lytic transglycosylase domain-containing protein n=1 Tax=Streptomyces sp. ODS28 TaxID=3136688 RepID=UPI0031E62A72